MVRIKPVKRLRAAASIAVFSAALILGTSAGSLAVAAETFRTLKGSEIDVLFKDLDNVNFPSDGTGSETDDWFISFDNRGYWEAATGGSDAYGTWRVEDDKQCVIVENNVTSSASEENIIFEGCFDVRVDEENGTIATDFPSIGKKDFVLKSGAFAELARIKPAKSGKDAVAATAPKVERASPPIASPVDRAEEDRKAAEQERLAQKQREAEAKARQQQAQAEKQRQEQQARSNQSQKNTLEQQRLATEAKLKQLRLELELERLRAQRTGRKPANADTKAPVIQAAQNLQTSAARVTIQGLATDNVSLVRVEVNGKRIDTRDGKFSTEARVKLGKNTLRITAFDAEGNKAEHVVTVTRQRDVPDIAYGNYHALVIGINDYASLPKLNTAIDDAETVAKTLEDLYGYTVTRLTNPTRADIIDAFDELRDELSEEDNLLIYYAGHGWLDQQTGAGYWMPVNARTDRRSRWISNATLTNALQGLLAKHVMIVADSCYSGTLTRSIKVPQRNAAYLERMAEKRARVVLSSGGLEPVADSGGGKHSVFAAQFLKALRGNEGVLDGTKLFEKVRHSVVLNADQTPEYSDIRRAGHEGGDFLFVRKN